MLLGFIDVSDEILRDFEAQARARLRVVHRQGEQSIAPLLPCKVSITSPNLLAANIPILIIQCLSYHRSDSSIAATSKVPTTIQPRPRGDPSHATAYRNVKPQIVHFQQIEFNRLDLCLIVNSTGKLPSRPAIVTCIP